MDLVWNVPDSTQLKFDIPINDTLALERHDLELKNSN